MDAKKKDDEKDDEDKDKKGGEKGTDYVGPGFDVVPDEPENEAYPTDV